MKLLWSRRAQLDLLEIGLYIARDQPRSARRRVEKLRARARKAAQAPLVGRVVPEIERQEIREVFAGNYRIVYRAEKDVIVVLTVFEGHRRLRPGDIAN